MRDWRSWLVNVTTNIETGNFPTKRTLQISSLKWSLMLIPRLVGQESGILNPQFSSMWSVLFLLHTATDISFLLRQIRTTGWSWKWLQLCKKPTGNIHFFTDAHSHKDSRSVGPLKITREIFTHNVGSRVPSVHTRVTSRIAIIYIVLNTSNALMVVRDLCTQNQMPSWSFHRNRDGSLSLSTRFCLEDVFQGRLLSLITQTFRGCHHRRLGAQLPQTSQHLYKRK